MKTKQNQNQTCDDRKHFVQHLIDLLVRTPERTVESLDLSGVGGHHESATLRHTAPGEGDHVAWSRTETCVEGVVTSREEGL